MVTDIASIVGWLLNPSHSFEPTDGPSRWLRRHQIPTQADFEATVIISPGSAQFLN